MDDRKFVNTICNAKLALTGTIPPSSCGPWVVHWGCSHLPHISLWIVASLFSWFLYFLLLLLGSPPAANCIRLISVTACSDWKRVTALYPSILSQKYLLGQSKMLTRTVIWKSRVPVKVVNGPTSHISWNHYKNFRQIGTCVNFIRQNGKTPLTLVHC